MCRAGDRILVDSGSWSEEPGDKIESRILRACCHDDATTVELRKSTKVGSKRPQHRFGTNHHEKVEPTPANKVRLGADGLEQLLRWLDSLRRGRGKIELNHGLIFPAGQHATSCLEADRLVDR